MKLIPILLCSAIITAADTAAGKTRMPDRERQVEEIVVTGSHLKREPRDLASPLTVLDKDDLDVAGATDPEGFSGSLPDPECEQAAAEDGAMGTPGLHLDVRYVIVPEHHFGLQLDAARRGFEPVPYRAHLLCPLPVAVIAPGPARPRQ